MTHGAPGVVAGPREVGVDVSVDRIALPWGEPHPLRDLHLDATEKSLYSELLAQAAQATKDDELLAVASACHPQTLRQLRWTNTMIKNLSPQILTSLS